MNKIAVKNVAKKVAVGSLTAAGKIVIGMFGFVDDMNFLRSHQSLCAGLSVREARAYLAETEAYRKEYQQAFRRLKKRGWIEEQKIGGRMMTILSKDGEVAALEIFIKNTPSKLSQGEYWMVAFDFPEAAHKARDMFRRYLKRIGFDRHQQSIWCTKKDTGKALRRLITILRINKWVRIYRASEYR